MLTPAVYFVSLLAAQASPPDLPEANVLVLNGNLSPESLFQQELAREYPCVLYRDWGETQSLATLDSRITDTLPKLADARERLIQGVKATQGCSSEFTVNIRHVWDAKTSSLWSVSGTTITRQKLPEYVTKLSEETIRGQFLVEALRGAVSDRRPISACPNSGCTLFHRFWVNNILSRSLLDRLVKLGNANVGDENPKLRISYVDTIISAYLKPEQPFNLEREKKSPLSRCDKTELKYSVVDPTRPWSLLCTRNTDTRMLRISPDPTAVFKVFTEEIPKHCDDVQLVLQDPDAAVQIAPGLAIVYSEGVPLPLEMKSDKCEQRLSRELREWSQTDLARQVEASWLTSDNSMKPPPSIFCIRAEDLWKLYSVRVDSTYVSLAGQGVKSLKVRVSILKRYKDQPGFSLATTNDANCDLKDPKTAECDVPRDSFQDGVEWTIRQLRMTIPVSLCNGGSPSASP